MEIGRITSGLPTGDSALQAARGLLDFLEEICPATMPLDGTEQLYLERQVILGRAILAALSLVALLETSWPSLRGAAVVFLSAYLVLAVAGLLVDRFASAEQFRIPLAFDFVVLAAFLYFTPSVSSFWFLFLFAVFALANRGQ